jgi:hypothetical protein
MNTSTYSIITTNPQPIIIPELHVKDIIQPENVSTA